MKRYQTGGVGEEGAAATEFALLTLVLVPTALFAVFFAELGQAKLKAQEAGRYLVWEMTAVGLSDWKDGNHEKLFATVRTSLLTEVEQRWTDDMQSATPTILNARGPKPISLTLSVDKAQTDLLNTETQLWDVGIAGSSAVTQGVDALFKHMGFNTKGRVEGSVQIKVKNTLLHNTMPAFYTEKMLMKNEFVLKVKQALIVEQWDLKSGASVVQVNQSGNATTDYAKQVQRMSFIGLTQYLGFLSMADSIFSVVNLHSPINAVVASNAMTGDAATSALGQQVFNPPGHSTVSSHYTNVYTDVYEANQSPYTKAYKKRGKFFLACKQPQRAEGECTY